MCIPSRCGAIRGVPERNLAPTLPEPGGGRVTAAVASFVSRFRFPENDPRGVESVIGLRLAESLDITGRPDVARELNAVLSHLGEAPEDEADEVDDVVTHRHVKRAAAMLEEMRAIGGNGHGRFD
jgi:hypothetical protein